MQTKIVGRYVMIQFGGLNPARNYIAVSSRQYRAAPNINYCALVQRLMKLNNSWFNVHCVNNKECIKYKLSDPISQSLMKKKW